ncbi:hypothetical protein D3C73_979870 [compost metagenome]
MRSAALVAQQRAKRHRLGQLQHVPQLAGKGHALVVPARGVAHIDVPVALLQLFDFADCCFQLLVLAHHRHVGRHPFAQLLMDHISVLCAGHLEQRLVFVRLLLVVAVEHGGRDILYRLLQPFNIFHGLRSGDHAAIDR